MNIHAFEKPELWEENSPRRRKTLDMVILSLKHIAQYSELSDIVLLMDGNMRIIYQNETALGLLGTRVGDECRTAMDGTGVACDGCPLCGGDVSAAKTVRCVSQPGGRNIHIELMASPVNGARGEVYGCLCIGRDITKMREMEEQKKLTLSMLSHDLKSPLTAIQCFADLLLEKELQPEEKETLESIKGSTEKAAGLVEDFLTLSRIEAGNICIEPVPLSLSTLVDFHSADCIALARRRNIMVLKNIPRGLPHAMLDERHCGRVLANLLDNAVRYIGDGGRIWIRAGIVPDGPDRLFLEVADDGPGIPASDLPMIFDRYYRAGRVRKGQGTGLGLAIVKALTELQGGRVEARSAEGEGTSIRLYLPAAPPEAQAGNTC